MRPERRFAERSAVAESVTLRLATKVARMKKSGIDVISFGAGAPDLLPPRHLVDHAWPTPDGSVHAYTDSGGLPPLRDAISDLAARSYRWSGDASNVFVSNGAKQALACVMMSVLNPGDEVIVLSPYWPTYKGLSDLMGARPVFVSVGAQENAHSLRLKLEHATSNRTRALLYSSPSNPTGHVLDQNCIDTIRSWSEDVGAWVIADELYQSLYYGVDDGCPSVLQLDAKHSQFIHVSSVSKTYSLMGWRVGWVIADSDLINRCAALQSHLSSNVNNYAQLIAMRAIATPIDEIRERSEVFRVRRDLMLDGLSRIRGLVPRKPDGGLFVWCDLQAGTSASAVADRLLETFSVVVVPGDEFGDDNGIRFSFAASEEDILRGLHRIGDSIA